MKQIDKREFFRLAREAGFQKVRSRGDHMILKDPNGRTMCITVRNPKSVVMLRLIKEFKLATV